MRSFNDRRETDAAARFLPSGKGLVVARVDRWIGIRDFTTWLYMHMSLGCDLVRRNLAGKYAERNRENVGNIPWITRSLAVRAPTAQLDGGTIAT